MSIVDGSDRNSQVIKKVSPGTPVDRVVCSLQIFLDAYLCCCDICGSNWNWSYLALSHSANVSCL